MKKMYSYNNNHLATKMQYIYFCHKYQRILCHIICYHLKLKINSTIQLSDKRSSKFKRESRQFRLSKNLIIFTSLQCYRNLRLHYRRQFSGVSLRLRFFLLTDHGAVTEEQLMKLRGERSEEAAERGNEAAQNCRDSCTFSSAKRYRHWRHQQGDTRRHCSQPPCNEKASACTGIVQTLLNRCIDDGPLDRINEHDCGKKE